MEVPEAKSVIVIVAGGLVVAAAIFSALPDRPPTAAPPVGTVSTSAAAPATTTPAANASAAEPPNSSASAKQESIQVDQPVGPAAPSEAVPISGTHQGAPGSTLQLQRLEGRRWKPFSTPTVADHSGNFSTRIELDQRGWYWFRVIDPESGTTSQPFLLVVRG